MSDIRNMSLAPRPDGGWTCRTLVRDHRDRKLKVVVGEARTRHAAYIDAVDKARDEAVLDQAR